MKTLSHDRTTFTAADPEWDLARRAWNLTVDQRPALADDHGLAGLAPFFAPDAYARLRRAKAAVDPADRIRSNHPIPL